MAPADQPSKRILKLTVTTKDYGRHAHILKAAGYLHVTQLDRLNQALAGGTAHRPAPVPW